MANKTLIVSPDPGLVRQTRGALEARGAQVTSVSTSQAARDAARDKPLQLVIAEVDLPGGSGYELCRYLKGQPNPPKVMLLYTAGEGSADRNAAECGADASVRRPFLTSQFLEQLVPMVGPEFFGGQFRAGGSNDNIRPEARNSSSLIDPGVGIFSDGVSVLGSGDYDALRTGDIQSVPGRPQTQELPLLNIETFDEKNPLLVPVSASVTAHALPVVSASQSVEVLIDDSYDSEDVLLGHDDDGIPDPFGRMSSLSRPSDDDLAPRVPGANGVEQAVEAHLDTLLEPGGRLASLLEQTVNRAISEALAQAIPAATRAAAERLAKPKGD